MFDLTECIHCLLRRILAIRAIMGFDELQDFIHVGQTLGECISSIEDDATRYKVAEHIKDIIDQHVLIISNDSLSDDDDITFH